MSNCPHGKYLGSGCDKCGKSNLKLSPVHKEILRLAAMMGDHALSHPEKKGVVDAHIKTLFQMRAHYPPR